MSKSLSDNMQPLSIAAGPLITARMNSLIGSGGRTRFSPGREVELLGTDNANALDPEPNATESPSGSTRIMGHSSVGIQDHSFLSLFPIEHAKAKPMPSSNGIRDGGHVDASTQTYDPVCPEPWYPSVIYHSNFTHGEPYFQYINSSDEATGAPSLMLNWEMFRSLWKLASTTRELQGKQQWHDSERHRYSILYKDLYQNSQKELQAISNLQALGYTRPDLRPELVLQGKQHQANIDANNATGRLLQLEEERVIESYDGKLEDVREAQNVLQPFLDELFGTLGVLPDVNDLAAPVEVPVIEPDTSSEDVLFVEWPENNWNDDCNHPGWGSEGLESTKYHDPDAAWNDAWQEYSTEEPIQRLSLEVEDKRHDALNAKADFDKFRGTYDEEFYKYMGRTSDAQAVAEKNFGPVWVQMSQSVTKRARDTEEAFYSAEERLSEAKRAAKLQIRAGASRDEISCVKVWDEAEVDNFGQMVPSRKRKHIDDWLEQETSCTKKTKTQAIESKPLSRKRKHSDDSLEEEVSPKKIKTQAIESEPSSRKRKHSNDSLEEVSPKKIKTQAIKDKPSSYKRKHSDDILELTSSSKKIKTQAAVDDDVIFDLSEHSADVSVVEVADGYQRRKIDNYIRQAQAARPILPGRRFSDTSLYLASNEVEL